MNNSFVPQDQFEWPNQCLNWKSGNIQEIEEKMLHD